MPGDPQKSRKAHSQISAPNRAAASTSKSSHLTPTPDVSSDDQRGLAPNPASRDRGGDAGQPFTLSPGGVIGSPLRPRHRFRGPPVHYRIDDEPEPVNLWTVVLWAFGYFAFIFVLFWLADRGAF